MEKSSSNSKPGLMQYLDACSSEEDVYNSLCRKEVWSVQEFAALVVGITPKEFSEILNPKKKTINPKSLQKVKEAQNITKKFIETIQEEFKQGGFKDYSKSIYPSMNTGLLCMLSWRFLKWAALNGIFLSLRFFKHLTLTQMELYLEFQPENTILRKGDKTSIRYHRALFIKHVEDLLLNGGVLTPKKIYEHPRIVNVRHSIGNMIRLAREALNDEWREKTGYNYPKQKEMYKRRTIMSWISGASPQKRGRPKKQK